MYVNTFIAIKLNFINFYNITLFTPFNFPIWFLLKNKNVMLYSNVACGTIGAFLSNVRGPNDKSLTKDLGNVEAISGDKFASDCARRIARVGLLLLTIVVCYDEKETH